MVRVRPPLSVPTYTHLFYERLFACEARVARFRDVPAFRDFVSYQVRLLNAVIARVRGFGGSDAMTIARLNHRLTAHDLLDMDALVDELSEQGLLDPEVASQCRDHLHTLRLALFQGA